MIRLKNGEIAKRRIGAECVTMKRKITNTNVRLPVSDKKKAIEYGFNISEICRHALKSRVRNYQKKLAREAAQQAPAPVQTLPQCSGIGVPAEQILDQTIAELEKEKGKDPSGSLPAGEVPTAYECADDQHKNNTVTPADSLTDREVAH